MLESLLDTIRQRGATLGSANPPARLAATPLAGIPTGPKDSRWPRPAAVLERRGQAVRPTKTPGASEPHPQRARRAQAVGAHPKVDRSDDPQDDPDCLCIQPSRQRQSVNRRFVDPLFVIDETSHGCSDAPSDKRLKTARSTRNRSGGGAARRPKAPFNASRCGAGSRWRLPNRGVRTWWSSQELRIRLNSNAYKDTTALRPGYHMLQECRLPDSGLPAENQHLGPTRAKSHRRKHRTAPAPSDDRRAVGTISTWRLRSSSHSGSHRPRN